MTKGAELIAVLDDQAAYEIFTIPLHHCRMFYIGIRSKAISIDQQMLRSYLQLVNGTVHSQKRSLQYVYLINFFRSNDADSPGYCLFLYNRTQGIPVLFAQLFAVIQIIVLEIRR